LIRQVGVKNVYNNLIDYFCINIIPKNAMKTFILNLPDHLGIDENEARMTLAAGLYKKGKLTMGQAADLAKLSKRTFMELLAAYDTEVVDYDPEELDNDLANAKDYTI
jgi:predicted HTH domain antitoxin